MKKDNFEHKGIIEKCMLFPCIPVFYGYLFLKKEKKALQDGGFKFLCETCPRLLQL